MTRTSNPFQRGSTDLFNGKNLKSCDNFEIPQLKSFKIRNYSTSIIPDGWQGVYIEIYFNNKSRLNCDLSNYGFIENETIQVEDHCKIKDKSKVRNIWGFFSPLVPSKREKNIYSFAQLVLLSLYTF